MPEITGNLAFPGFTAPKILWVQENEPEVAGRLRKVLLPKDYLRLRMTGASVADTNDASGTLWLDVAARRWSDALLAATGRAVTNTPELVESNAPPGQLRPSVARAWGYG